jgi:ferredoxin
MKTKLHMRFPAALTTTPVTYELIRTFDLKLNILKANIDFNLIGTILYDVEGSSKNIADALAYLEAEGLEIDLIPSVITIDEKRCTDCGLCTSVCGIKALTIAAPDWKLNFDSGKCIGCNHCIPVCPTRAISGLMPEPA